MSEWVEWLCQYEQSHGQRYAIGGTGGELLGVYRTSDMTLVGEFSGDELLHFFRGLTEFGNVAEKCMGGLSETHQEGGARTDCMTDIERACYVLDTINSEEGE